MGLVAVSDLLSKIAVPLYYSKITEQNSHQDIVNPLGPLRV